MYYVSNMVWVEGVKCSSFCNFRFECMNRTLHLCILPSVNALPTLMHSEYLVQKHVIWDTSMVLIVIVRLITQIPYLTVAHSTKFKLPLTDFRWKYIDSLQHWHSQKLFCLPAPHTLVPDLLYPALASILHLVFSTTAASIITRQKQTIKSTKTHILTVQCFN